MDNSTSVFNATKDKIDQDELKRIFDSVKENIKYGDIIWGDYKPNTNQEKDLVEKIETQLIQNNFDYTDFPSDYLHGQLCKYANKSNSKRGETFRLLNSFWKTIDTFFLSNPNELSAILYSNQKSKNLVLVFKTYDFNFTLHDDESLVSNDLDLCQKLIKQITVMLKETYKDYNFSLTGYLTGAWLAEYSNYYLTSNYNLSNKTKAVLFESPGIIRPKENLLKELTLVKKRDSNLVNYFTPPNIFNTFNKHDGKMFKISPKEIHINEISDMLEQLINSEERSFDIHKKVKYSRFFYAGMYAMYTNKCLDLILDEFDSTTGKPFICDEVLNWPSFDFQIDNKTPLVQTKMPKLNNIQLINKFAKKISQNIPGFEDSSNKALCPVKTTLIESHLRPNSTIVIEILDELILKGIDFSKFLIENLNSNESFGFRLTLGSTQIRCEFKPEYVCKKYDFFKQDLIESHYEHLQLIDLNDFKTKHFKSNVFVSYLSKIKSLYNIEHSNDKKKKFIVSNYYTIDFISEKFKRLTYLDINVEILIMELNLTQQADSIECNLPIFEDQFSGRKKSIIKIHQWFQTNNMVIICGDSGTGKSRLAVHIGYHYMKNNIVRIINSEAVEELELDYCEFANRLLKIDPRSIDMDSLIGLVNHKLKEFDSNFFIIFDNVDDYSVIEKFIKYLPLTKVKIIITTRHKNLISNPDIPILVELLEPFDLDESNDYFSKNININRKLNYLKLPLEFYLGVRYINFYTELDPVFSDMNSESSIFKILFKKLKKESEDAFNMLTYCSLLDADAISFNLLRKLIDDKNLSSNVICLKNYGLITINYDKSFISMHRLIQKEFIKFFNIDYVKIVEHITTTLYLIIRNDVNLDQNKEFDYFHLRKILSIAKQNSISLNRRHEVTFKKQLANFNFHFRHNYKDALNDYKHLYELIDVDPEANAEELSTCIYELAMCYMKTEKYQEGLVYHNLALDFRTQICENDSLRSELLADSYQSLGDVYFALKKYQEALSYYTKSLDVRNEFHLDRSISLYSLGNIYTRMFNLEKALENFLNAYMLKKDVISLDLARIAYNLGNIYDKLGNYESSYKYYLDSYKIRESFYKFDHIELAESIYALATIFDKLAEYDSALEYHKKAFFMRKNLFKVVPNQTSSALVSAFETFKRIGASFVRAENQSYDDIIHAKDAARFIIENKHPVLAQSLNSIGLVLSNLQNDKLAFQYIQIAYQIRRTIYKEPHPDLVDSLNSLAIFMGKTGNNKNLLESVDYKLKAEEMNKKLVVKSSKIFIST